MLCLDLCRRLVLPQTLECCLAQVSVAGKTLILDFSDEFRLKPMNVRRLPG